MNYEQLLSRYEIAKEAKQEPYIIAKRRTKAIDAMYKELSDFTSNTRVKILLNEDLTHFRKLRKAKVKIASFEFSTAYILYRYLIEKSSNGEHLKNNLNSVEITEINQRLVETVYEYNILEYFTHKFDHKDHHDRLRAVLYYAFNVVQDKLGVEGKMLLAENSLTTTLNRLSGSNSTELKQFDELFTEINELGYQQIQEKNTEALASTLFVLNFDKGNKAYAVFYLKKLYEVLDSDTNIIPLLNVIEKEFLQ